MKNVDDIINKETYLQWRAEWRADYASLSKHIRLLKSLRRFQDITRSNPKTPRFTPEDTARFHTLEKELGLVLNLVYLGMFTLTAHDAIAKAKAQATAMLEARKAAKQAAQGCYVPEHAMVPA